MMLLAAYLLLTPTVLRAQVFPYQIPPFLFVDVGGSAEISCVSSGNAEHRAFSFSWYQRREGGTMRLVKNCLEDKSEDRFVCRAKGNKMTLGISHLEATDSGLYLCAEGASFVWALAFGNGSSLVVGDSYAQSSRVVLLQPPVDPAPQSGQSDHLACLVHGVSNLVQVSWDVPGGLQREERTLLVQNSSSSLTFLSLLHVPTDSWASGGLFTCEVRFNSSGTSVRKSVAFNTTSSSGPDDGRACQTDALPLAVMGTLALLLLLGFLALLRIRLCCSKPAQGAQPQNAEPPASEESPQEGPTYAQLDFGLETQERKWQSQAFLDTEKPA